MTSIYISIHMYVYISNKESFDDRNVNSGIGVQRSDLRRSSANTGIARSSRISLPVAQDLFRLPPQMPLFCQTSPHPYGGEHARRASPASDSRSMCILRDGWSCVSGADARADRHASSVLALHGLSAIVARHVKRHYGCGSTAARNGPTKASAHRSPKDVVLAVL
jgi:hypothetical protein